MSHTHSHYTHLDDSCICSAQCLPSVTRDKLLWKTLPGVDAYMCQVCGITDPRLRDALACCSGQSVAATKPVYQRTAWNPYHIWL